MNKSVLSKAKVEYEEYLAEFMSHLQKEEHKESEGIWKLSSRGVKSNRRLLHIYSNYLVYYSKIPKDFNTNQHYLLSSITPKAAVKLCYFATSASLKDDYSKKTKFLILEFPANKLIRFKKGKENPVFDATKVELIEKTPIKSSDFSKLKWAFSTNPAISLLTLKEKSLEEIFLLKLIDYIHKCATYEKILSIKNIENPENENNYNEEQKSQQQGDVNKEDYEKKSNEEEAKKEKQPEEKENQNIKTEEKDKSLNSNHTIFSQRGSSQIDHHKRSNERESLDNKRQSIESGKQNENKLKENEIKKRENGGRNSNTLEKFQTANWNNSKNLDQKIEENDELQMKKYQNGNRNSKNLDQNLNENELKMKKFPTVQSMNLTEPRGSVKSEKENLSKTVNPSKSSLNSLKKTTEKKSIWGTFKGKIFSESPESKDQSSHKDSPDNRPKILSQEEILNNNDINLIRPTSKMEYSSHSLDIDFKPKSMFEFKKDDFINPERKYDIRSKILLNLNRSKIDSFSSSNIFDESIPKNERTKQNSNILGFEPYNFNETIDDIRDTSIKNQEKLKMNKNQRKIEILEENEGGFQKKNIFQNSSSSKTKQNWEDLFYKTLKENYISRLDYKKNMSNELTLIEILLEFQGFSQNLMKNIVNELFSPQSQRNFIPMVEKPDLFIFNLKKEGLLIKMSGFGYDTIEEMMSTWKSLANEYRSNIYAMNRIIENMKKNSKQTYYKVPLSCLIDYMGFRALVYCKSNWIDGDKTLVLGFDSNDKYQKNIFLNDNIIIALGNILNIRRHFVRPTFLVENMKVLETDLVSTIEIHQSLCKIKAESDCIKNNEFYVLNTTHILPDIYNPSGNFNEKRLEKYRPEFIDEYFKEPHNPEWLISEPFQNEFEMASFFLKNYEKNFINLFEILEKKQNFFKNYLLDDENPNEFNIMDHETLAKILHVKGINIKNMGILYSNFSHSYLNLMCLNEMVVRTCKKLIRFHMAKLFFEAQAENELNHNTFLSGIHQNLVDFFNLIFYKKIKDSQIFWREVIWPKLESTFEVKLSLDVKENYQIKANYMIHLLESVGLEGDFYTLMHKKNFFNLDDFKDLNLNPKSNHFNIQSIECFSLFKSHISKENELFQKQLYRLFGLENAFNLKVGVKLLKEGNSKQFSQKNNLPNNSKIQQNIREMTLCFMSYLNLKDPHNALKILDKISEYLPFCYPKNHPFYVNLMIQLRDFYLIEGFEEETIFLSKKILAKLEKSIGDSGCFHMGIYENMLITFSKFNSSINEKIYCLEKICLIEKENSKFTCDLIKNHLKRGDKKKAIEFFKKFSESFREKKSYITGENCNDLLNLNDLFHKVNEEMWSNECLKIIWIFMIKRKINSNDLQYIFSQYFSRMLSITVEGLSSDIKEILKAFLTDLKKKNENLEIYLEKIFFFIKSLSHDNFSEFFKDVLTRILLKHTIDEKNKEEEIIEAILFLINS